MRKKRLRLLILVTILFLISIGFAVLTSNLSINGLFNFTPNTWNIYLDNIVVDETSTTTGTPSISEDKDTITFSASLNKPGDYYSFNVDIVNDSTIDAMLGNITIEGITSEYSDYLSCLVTYSNGTQANQNDILYKTARVTLNVKLLYKDITIEQIPEDILNPTISVTINYRQSNNNAVLVEDTNHWNFDYTGNSQEFNIPLNGTYKIELWGAQGETDPAGGSGGSGGYTSGMISLNESEKYYIFVGSMSKIYPDKAVGYNGGGDSQFGGGGSTDIRIVDAIWNDFISLKSRIMVAGGGAGNDSKDIAGSSGGLIGYNGNGQSGTQISGGTGFASGGFGFGGGSGNHGTNGNGGGGSGYFGGSSSFSETSFGGAGGSSFISGHAGCVAIDESSTEDNIVFKNDTSGVDCSSSSSSTYNSLGYNTDQKCSIHYSSKVFRDTVMIDGNGYQWTTIKSGEVVGMPNKNGIGKVTGNTGNGYARITFIG